MTLQSLIPLKARTGIAALSFVAMMVPLLGPGYASADSFVQTNLVSDIPEWQQTQTRTSKILGG
jgi:hypothetical protein